MTENTEQVQHTEECLHSARGESSTVAAIGESLCSQDEKKSQFEMMCSGGQPGGRDVPKTPSLQKVSDLCGLPLMLKLCRLHSQCVVKRMNNLNVGSAYSSAMTFDGKSKEPGPAKITCFSVRQ